jgi:hypothetical protein
MKCLLGKLHSRYNLDKSRRRRTTIPRTTIHKAALFHAWKKAIPRTAMMCITTIPGFAFPNPTSAITMIAAKDCLSFGCKNVRTRIIMEN